MITLFEKKLCESCFSENSGDPCSKCGFCAAKYHPDSTALPIGQTLQERYLIGGVIGKGGFGITYTAFDKKLERRVAIKEYYPYGLALRTPGTTMVSAPDTDAEDVFSKGADKFYDEARLVAKFSGNQNIVNVFDFFYENSTVYYVMEYLQGQSMKKYIEKHGTVSEEQAVYIAKEVSNALVASHSSNVLHRDISPDNIMLCNDGKVKLIDFGAARQVLSEGSQSLSVILKQGFAPLEQYQKKGKQGPWTDIYALGATMYYIVTGDLLDDPMSRLDDDEEFSSNTHGINEGLWNVIKKATMLKIGDRYKDIFEFREDLNGISVNSVPLTVSYDDSVEMLPLTASPAAGETMPVKEAAPVGATMPVKEAAPIGATMPVKEAAPIGATMPVKEAAPIGATMPVKEAAPIGATMPVKEAAPIGATMPVKEAAPIGATMPVKEAKPIGATMPVKEQASNEKKTDFTDKYNDEEWRLEARRAASAAAYDRRQQSSEQNKKKLLIILSIISAIIIVGIIIFLNTHVKIGNRWQRIHKDSYGDSTVHVSCSEKISDLSALAKKKSVTEVDFAYNGFSDPSVLEDLKEMENLRELDLTYCKLGDISALEGLTGLTYLDLGTNAITDISALKSLTGLTYLDLRGNEISDLSPLKKLTKLEYLYITYNGEELKLYDDKIQEFLDKNVKISNSQAEPEKPAQPEKTDKPAQTEPEKPAQTEPEKPAMTEPDKPEVTEPEKPEGGQLTFEQHVENQVKAYREQLASIDDAISYYVTEMDGNGDPAFDIGNNYYEMIVLAGKDEVTDVRYEFYRYDDYRQKAIYMGEISASHSSLVWDFTYGFCVSSAWQGFITANRIVFDGNNGNKVIVESEPVYSIMAGDEEPDVIYIKMTPANDLSKLTKESLSDTGLE